MNDFQGENKALMNYPFGMLMPGRNFGSERYRFRFNGKENDDEVKGAGNSLDFGARVYDPRLGRWFSPDRIIKLFESRYTAFHDNPILFVDPDGKDPRFAGEVLDLGRHLAGLEVIYVTDIIGGKYNNNTYVRDFELFKKSDDILDAYTAIGTWWSGLLEYIVTPLFENSEFNRYLTTVQDFQDASFSRHYSFRELKGEMTRDGLKIHTAVDYTVSDFGIEGFEAEVSNRKIYNIEHNVKGNTAIARLVEETDIKLIENSTELRVKYGLEQTDYVYQITTTTYGEKGERFTQHSYMNAIPRENNAGKLDDLK